MHKVPFTGTLLTGGKLMKPGKYAESYLDTTASICNSTITCNVSRFNQKPLLSLGQS